MPKSTDHFKKVIQDKLNELGEKDSLFQEKLNNPKKNIDDCCTYIISEVQKTGRCGFADYEVYGMAIHYYDEEEIKVGKPVKCQIVINQPSGLTEEEKAQAKEEAREQVFKEEVDRQKARLKKRAKKSKEVESVYTQSSLFG